MCIWHLKLYFDRYNWFEFITYKVVPFVSFPLLLKFLQILELFLGWWIIFSSVLTSSQLSKRPPFSVNFNFGNSMKSAGTKPREYSGSDSTVAAFFANYCLTSNVWVGALSWCNTQLCAFHIREPFTHIPSFQHVESMLNVLLAVWPYGTYLKWIIPYQLNSSHHLKVGLAHSCFFQQWWPCSFSVWRPVRVVFKKFLSSQDLFFGLLSMITWRTFFTIFLCENGLSWSEADAHL